MRTYFEPEDGDAFDAAKDLFARRCTAWAGDQSLRVDAFALDVMLNFRQDSIDGRLGYWTTALVEKFLLSYVPRKLSISARDAADFPETLRLAFRYLHATGLADPAGDPLPDLDAAVVAAGAAFPGAMADERNFGLAKFWIMTAIRHGVDPADGPAMNSFREDARGGRVDYDEEVLAHIAARHVEDRDEQPERAVAQLPVSLPADSELAAVAENSAVVTRLRDLVDWVGAGRALTTTGNVKLADARELVALLDTGDTVDPTIGDRVFRTTSSVELAGLTLTIELAKKIRLVRVVKNRLVRVAKAAPLLRDGLALWTAAFDALLTLNLLRRGASWVGEHTLMLAEIIGDVLPDVLNTVYGLPEPIPMIRLAESVWSACTVMFDLDVLGPEDTTRWREGVGADLRGLLSQLAEFSAAELTVGWPDPMFRADLDPGRDLEPGEPAALPSDAQQRLRAALDPARGPVELVSLTPLATRAVHARLVREGRFAPLIGELSDAQPTQLLGVLAEHYSPEAAQAEIAGWLAAHGGPERGLARLLDGIRACPFRTRMAAMLDVLAQTVPDRSTFLRGLRADRQLGPIVSQLLVDDGAITMDDLGPEEGLRVMAEQFIHLLEVGGFDAAAEALAQAPAGQAREIVEAMLASGHPDRAGLDELRVVGRPYLAPRRPGHASVHPLAGLRTGPKNRSTGKRRR